MEKNIEKMDTHEIMRYLTKERFVHGLFYVDRDLINERFALGISETEWLGFVNFYTDGFNERNDFLFDGEIDVIEDWKKDRYQYGSMLIDEAEKFI